MFEIQLSSGKTIKIRKPMMKDARTASELASRGDSFNQVAFMEQFLLSLIVEVKDKDEKIIQKGSDLDSVLDFAEFYQLKNTVEGLEGFIPDMKKKGTIKKLS